jgi:hypothetical protein
MSEPGGFALTPAEEAFFRRFFQRLAMLEAKIEVTSPPAAPAPQPVSVPADLGGFRERLYAIEERLSRLE